MTTYNTGDPIGTVSAYNLYDDAENLDFLLLGPELAYNDRLGVSRTSWAGLVKQFLTGGAAMAFADKATLLAFTPTQSNVLAMDSSSGTYYRWDGTSWTAISNTSMPWYYDLLSAINGLQFSRQDLIYRTTNGSYYAVDGTLKTDGGTTWGVNYIPVKSGQIIKANVVEGSYTAGEVRAVFTQLNSSKGFVATLRTLTSASAPFFGTYYAIASQDGFIAVSYRIDSTSLGSGSIYLNTISFSTQFAASWLAVVDTLKAYGRPVLQSNSRFFAGYVYATDGTLSTGNGTDRGVQYIPVRTGDIVRITGTVGNQVPGSTVPVMLQLTSNRVYVGTLLSVISNGNLESGTYFAKATQDGVIAVAVRALSPVIYRIEPMMSAGDGQNDTFALRDVTPEATIVHGSRYNTSGVVEAASGWWYALLPCRSGDVFTLEAVQDTYTSGEITAVGVQLNTAKAFVSVVTSYTSTGSGPSMDAHSIIATQDGYVALSFRMPGNNPFRIMSGRVPFNDSLSVYMDRQLSVSGVADYTNVLRYEENNYFIDSTFAKLADPRQRIVWVPVQKGDTVSLETATGILGPNETAASDGTVPYLIQYDSRRANPVILAKVAVTGTEKGYQVLSATATKDGWIACRVYAVARDWPYAKRLRATSSSTSTATLAPVVTGEWSRLPVQADTNWDYNNCPYTQDNVVVAGNYIYVVIIGANRIPYIMQRIKDNTGPWTVFDLSTVSGNPLNSPTEQDGHNVYVIGVSAAGYLIVAGNMHGSGPRAVVSTNPNDISAWTAIDFSAGLHTADVTYPHFLKYPDGTLQIYYRWGVRHYLTTFDDTTKTFINPKFIVGARSYPDESGNTGGPYEQKYVVDNSGTLHVCWGYRMSSASALANQGLWYAKSTDKGTSWTAADGTNPQTGTLNDAKATRIFTAELSSGYVNQNGGSVDINGRYHTTLTQYDANGFTQIVHIWFDGTAWQNEVVTKFDFTMDLSSNLVTNDICRPVIGCTPSGKTFIFYHTSYDGLGPSVRAINVTAAGSPVDMSIAAMDIGYQSLGFNVSYMLATGDFLSVLAKGTANSSSIGYGGFNSQGIMLVRIPMP